MNRIINDKGYTFDLAPKQVITVEVHNPLFNNADFFLQDVGQEFSLPFTEHNKVLCKMGHLAEVGNDAYLQPVHHDIAGTPLSIGNLRYRVGKDSFIANLEPNFAAINDLARNIRLPEIRTEDGVTGIADIAAYEAMMLDTVQHPDKYPYIFFPVHNPSWAGPVSAEIVYPFINYFDKEEQRFIASKDLGLPGELPIANTPFWKVTHILKELANYLGFNAVGDFFSDEEMKNICILTRVTHQSAYFDRDILPSMMYMPNMTIPEFLKVIRDRLHLAINFNLLTREMTVERFKSILNKKPIDLSGYVGPEQEQALPEKIGATVTLKSDEQDAKFKVSDANGNDSYPPLFKLVAGDGGEEPTELDCSTTKGVDESLESTPGAKYPTVDQTVINRQAHFVPDEPGTGYIPPDLSSTGSTDPTDPTQLNNWPLRIVNFEGWEATPDGHFPNAVPYDLNEDDAAWFRFMNDARELVIPAELPPVILSQLRPTDKFTHRTEGGNFINYIIEKFVYDAGSDSELVPVKIYARSLNSQIDTKVSIEPVVSAQEGSEYDLSLARGRIKAYFDPAIHGFKELQLEAYDTVTLLRLNVQNIVHPTNRRGTGGQAVNIFLRTDIDIDPNPFELRVLNGYPRYILYRGRRSLFTDMGAYRKTIIDWYADGLRTALADTYTIFF